MPVITRFIKLLKFRTFLLASTAIFVMYGLKPLLSQPHIAAEMSPRLGPILILTAHPDDESMFFAPTILALTAQGHEIMALCLSNGRSNLQM